MVLTPDGERLPAPAAASTTSATATRRRWSRSSAAAPTSRGRTATCSSPPTASTPHYELIKNVVNSQNYVSKFELDDYPVRAEDILHTGPAAFDAALNTVNIGKFNLGFASIGICEHAFYEAITHADARVLYGMRVTDFPHVRQAFTDAYARLVAMKLFADRAIDYMRCGVARRPALPALQPDHEDEGDDRGRAGDRPALGRDRRQGVREGHVLRDGGARHPRRCRSSRAPCT